MSKPTNSNNRLFLLDGMALAYRAHFAFIRNPRLTSDRRNTSAVFGFVNTLLDVLRTYQPSHIAVAFDTREPTHRHKQFPQYKAQRDQLPEDIAAGLPYIFAILEALRIPVLRYPGWEADDVIGALARQAEQRQYTCYMVTPDKDFAQLVSERVRILKPERGGGLRELGRDEICSQWNITEPRQVVEVLGLWGDASDNIPGVPGIGEKTAKQLIGTYGSIDNLLLHIDELKGKLRERLLENADQARLARELVTIVTDLPLQHDLDELEIGEPDLVALKQLFIEMEFSGIGKQFFGDDFVTVGGASTNAVATPAVAAAPGSESRQLDLFDFAAAQAAPPPSPTTPPPPEQPALTLRTLADVPQNYQLIAECQQCRELVETLLGYDQVCFNIQTTSPDPKLAQIIGVAFSWAPGTGAYVALPAVPDQATAWLEELQRFFAAEHIEKVGHNLKFDLGVLSWHQVAVTGCLFDTMLAHALVEPDMKHSIEYLAQMYLTYNPMSIQALIGADKGPQLDLRQVPSQQLCQYAVETTDLILQLRQVLAPLLTERGVDKVFREVEAPLLPALVSMEHEGIRIDQQALAQFSALLGREIETLAQTIHAMVGGDFNIDSPKQLGEVLFDTLKLEDKPAKTATGQYATSEQVLSRLASKHEVIQQVLDYREMRKLKNTYVDTLPEAIFAGTGRVHTQYSQIVTSTGRLQSHSPNLQNIPIRTELGRQIRRAFVPRNDQFVLLSADYSQIELRVIAAISKDAAMLQAFSDGEDIHRTTAARIYHVEPLFVTPEMRRRAKVANFGIAYGISAFGLAQRLSISRREASDIIAEYYHQFPGIKHYMEATIAFAREHGYVQTLLGRRQYLPDINSRNATQRGATERNAINTPIQGTAADLIKIAMANIHRRLCDGGYQSRMLLQVHDELVFDVHHDEVETIKPLIRTEMTQAIELCVPLVVDLGIGNNWLDAH